MWILKISNEFKGRGISLINLESLKILDHLKENFNKGDESIPLKLQNLLEKYIPNKLKLISRSLYVTSEYYLHKFIENGGSIEPCISLNFRSYAIIGFISPSKEEDL